MPVSAFVFFRLASSYWKHANLLELVRSAEIVKRIMLSFFNLYPCADKSGLGGIDSVIPICARTLRYGDTDKENSGDEDTILCSRESPINALERLSTSSEQARDPIRVVQAPGVEAFPEHETNNPGPIDHRSTDSRVSHSSFKAPSKSTAITYIRPTEDISRYILLYPSVGSQPLFTTIRSFEDDAHCLITRTHPDQTESLGHTLNFQSDESLRPGGDVWEDAKILEIKDVDVRANVAEEAYLASIRRAGTRDVARALWWAWYSLEIGGRFGGEDEEGGMGRVGWQECKDVMGNNDDLAEELWC